MQVSTIRGKQAEHKLTDKQKCLIGFSHFNHEKTQPLAAQSCNPFKLVGCNMVDYQAA